MAAKLIDGKGVANGIREEIAREAARLKERGVIPGLAVVLVGDDPASASYVRGKERACEELGLYSDNRHLPGDISERELLEVIDELNNDERIHGILVQLPVPPQIDEEHALLAINPDKDADGIHPMNLGRLVLGSPRFLPCTPHGVLKLLDAYGISTIGANVVIIGRSNIVGKPLANMLMQRSPSGNATVTLCHTKTKDLSRHTRSADILISAIGQPGLVTGEMIKEGAVVIDVGTTRVEDATKKRGYRLAGDIDFDSVREKASYLTPVPGGVGPMTITMLMYNTVESARLSWERDRSMNSGTGKRSGT
jgi:methylenetetrahydrofolate dehydrogenase (NADP+)/methenyltetrahydrofolate cyclohydrolase